MNDEVDFIIVGAGSAGCVLAHRLSADPGTSLALIEAGGADDHWKLAMPLACGQVFYDPRFSWNFTTEPEPHADDRVLVRGAGKVLGGGSSVNGMMYTRGHRRDYDGWAAMGCTGWSFAEILPYFRRAERHWRGDDGLHGATGPLGISKHEPDTLFAAVAETARKRGEKICVDFDRDDPDGFGIPDFTTAAGRRASTARQYLEPVRRRSNLRVTSKTNVRRVLFEGRRAVGVECERDGRVWQLRARREVILSAGAYNSPRLLMLSGIGPADDLSALGIVPLLDLPGVGRNLQEHPGSTISFAARDQLELNRTLRLDRLMLQAVRWRLTGTGPVARLPFTAMAFIRTQPELALPDVELLFTPAAFDARIWFPGWRPAAADTIGIGAFVMRPKSRGWVKLRSADPRDPPRIQLNALAEQDDRDALIASVRRIRAFMATEPAASLVGAEIAPGAAADSDDAIAAHLRQTVRTMQHPTSSCTMGIGDDAVVDPELRVRGVEGLRVIDASIMPLIIGGHTNAPTIMIGEKGADLVLGRRATS